MSDRGKPDPVKGALPDGPVAPHQAYVAQVEVLGPLKWASDKEILLKESDVIKAN